MIAHRPHPEILMDHVAGTLPAASALAIAAHAALCRDTAAEIAHFERLGGALLQRTEPAPLGPDALAKTLARLDAVEPERKRTLAVTDETAALLPQPLWPVVGGNIGRLEWRHVGPGIEIAKLIESGDDMACLMRVAAGRRVAKHTHCGLELTLVLDGAYHDRDEYFTRGDIQIVDSSVDHSPRADPGRVCLCFVAFSAPLRLTGPLGSLLNPFIRL